MKHILVSIIAALGMFRVVGLILAIGNLPAQAQQGRQRLNASSTNVAPEPKVESLPSVTVTAAAPTDDRAADKAWNELVRAENAHFSLPAGLTMKGIIGTFQPVDLGNFIYSKWIPDELKRANQEADFCARFPNYSKVWDARTWEYHHLVIACQMTNVFQLIVTELKAIGSPVPPMPKPFTNLLPRLAALEDLFLANTNLSPSNQFAIRKDRVSRMSLGPAEDCLEAAEALQRDFPNREGSYQELAALAETISEDKARSLARTVLGSPAPEGLKAGMRDLLRRLDTEGKPVSLHFTALDGREVDTAKMKGQVVLLAFWEPKNIPALPYLKAACEKFQPRGLEIIGICLAETREKATVTKRLKTQKISWPQYFDGQGWNGDLVRQYAIHDTPTLLLLDKQGNLRLSRISRPMVSYGFRGTLLSVGLESLSVNWDQEIQKLLDEP